MQLLHDIEKYLRASNTSPTRFGRDAVGDPRFVLDLRNGREPRSRTVTRVLGFIARQSRSYADA